jgi:hypothetical protein
MGIWRGRILAAFRISDDRDPLAACPPPPSLVLVIFIAVRYLVVFLR